jgi:hypothetical protein
MLSLNLPVIGSGTGILTCLYPRLLLGILFLRNLLSIRAYQPFTSPRFVCLRNRVGGTLYLFWGITYWLWPNTAFFSSTGGKYDSYSQIRIFTVLICPKHMVVLFNDLDHLDEFLVHLVALYCSYHACVGKHSERQMLRIGLAIEYPTNRRDSCSAFKPTLCCEFQCMYLFSPFNAKAT